MENQVCKKNSFFGTLKKVKWWGWLAGACSLGIQSLYYYLSNIIVNALNITPICTKIDVIDNFIPIVPAFAVVYVLSYIFWFLAPVMASTCGKEHFKKFVIGQLIAYTIGFVIYIIMPTYMDRVAEGLLEYAENGHWLLKIIYNVDGGAHAFNLLPSYHCLTSVYSYLAVRKQNDIPYWYRIVSLVMAILICLATVFIKQHYFLDLVAGVGIAIICYVTVNLIYKLKAKKLHKSSTENIAEKETQKTEQ